VGERTFWEQSIVAVLCIASQEPPVAEIVVALNELDAVAASEAQLVWTPRLEFVCRAVSVAGWHLPFNAACGLRQRGRGAASLTHDDENVARTSPVGGISGGHGGSSSRDAEGAGQGGRRERAVGVAGDYHLRSTLNVHHAVGRLALQQLRRGAASGAVVAADGCSCRDTRGSCRPVQENGEQASKGRVGIGGGAGSASARPFEAVNEMVSWR
jgi:hypothetical protein